MSDNPDDKSDRREPRTPTGTDFDPSRELPGDAPPPPPESAEEPITIERPTAPPQPIVRPPVDARRGAGGIGILLLLVFIILGGAIGFVWYSGTRQDRVLEGQLALLQGRQPAPTNEIDALAKRVAMLEGRQAPSVQQIDELAQRVAALEKRQQATAAPASSGAPSPGGSAASEEAVQKLTARTAALEQRVDKLASGNAGLAAPTQTAQQEGRPGPAPASPSFQALEQRVAALEQRAAPTDVATKADITALAGRMDALASRQDKASGQYTATLAAFSGRLEAEDSRIQGNTQAIDQTRQALSTLAKLTDDHIAAVAQHADQQITLIGTQTSNQIAALGRTVDTIQTQVGTLQKTASELPALIQRAAKIARIQAAQSALSTGQPLGQIPDAPAALARFAGTRPPTEAQLRLSFPAAARAAEDAESSLPAGATFMDRVRANAEGLFTIRRGDQVIVGNPASGILARARQALDAGDLAGAVDDLSQLQEPAAQTMAGWLDQARALLAARAALAQMAANT